MRLIGTFESGAASTFSSGSAKLSLLWLPVTLLPISRSRPLLTASMVECVPPQSVMTSPWKPQSVLSAWLMRNAFSEQYYPFTRLYAVITAQAWPSVTAALNAGR